MWFALTLAGCSFDPFPIVDRDEDPDGGAADGGDAGGTGGTGGWSGGGGASGRGGAGASGAGAGGRSGTGGQSGTGGSTCVPNTFIECDGANAIRCASDGRGRVVQDCGTLGCNAPEMRCNVCVSSQKFCNGTNTSVLTCGANGSVAATQPCPEGCNRTLSPPACNECTPNASFCVDEDTLRSCDSAGNAQDDVTCSMGCTNQGNGTAACNTCLPGTVLGCADSSHQLRCNDTGSGTETASCTNGCSGDGVCNACAPNTASCAGANTLRTCNSAGSATSDSNCEYGCGTSGNSATCNACLPSTVECRGDDLVTCSANGTVASSDTCSYGCDNLPDPDACTLPVLQPANLPADTCSATSMMDLSVGSGATRPIDTSSAGSATCTRVVAQGAGLPDICVMIRRDITIAAGGTLRVSGSRAFALVALNSMTIQGTIDVSADGVVSGPGSLSSGSSVGDDAPAQPDGSLIVPANAGGGGGGYGTNGARGGDGPGACPADVPCADSGSGGLAGTGSNPVRIDPLRGGARGGHNSAALADPRRVSPGGGGGALELVSCSATIALVISGSAIIDAGGGGGEGGVATSSGSGSPPPGAGAGGGSGGAILIEGLLVTIAPGAILAANGGGGGGGAAHDTQVAGEDGEDGRRSPASASGGTSGGGTSLAGGKGGSIQNDPTQGGDATGDTSAAGGGGGAVGRIRIDDLDGSIGSPSSSPLFTAGLVTTN